MKIGNLEFIYDFIIFKKVLIEGYWYRKWELLN